MEEIKQYTPKDFKSDQYVRWCPGCGDYAILNSLQKVMADMGVAPQDIAVISGIGCSSRLPYYINSYGFHTIHGRAAAVASGVKIANPKLTVWQISGDGDGLAIGGNHFIHSVRRNIDMNVLLFNNQIYGLTKGQFSPTTKKGSITKSSPFGTIERPFRPAELTFGSRGTFFARLLDVDLKNATETIGAAARHKGTSIVECLVNCVIFNHGAHGWIAEKETRPDRIIFLEHGKPMIYGVNRDKGLVLDGFNLKAVTIGENGITQEDLLVHNAKEKDPTLHYMLVRLESPLATGVIRSFEDVTLEEREDALTAQVKANSSFTKTDDLCINIERL